MAKTHTTADLCPRCFVRFIHHAHCPNVTCSYCLHVCLSCDKMQAVDEMLDDHLKDCDEAPPMRVVVEASLQQVLR